MTASLLDTDLDDADPMGELVAGEHQIIHVPNTLRAKTGPGERVDPARIKAAEKAIQEMAELRGILNECVEGKHEIAGKREKIYDISHNVKGQGSTFGYTLLTSVADNLCSFLDSQDDLLLDHVPVLMAHTEALHAILRFDVKGSDDPTGQEIVRSLHVLIRKQAIKASL